MLATANSSIAAVDKLKERGANNIRFLCLLAAPEGIEKFSTAHPTCHLHRRHRQPSQREGLHHSRPRRRRRSHVRDQVSQ
jgi:hypothetical protein